MKEFDKKYKREDIKEALTEIYNYKCAYCEKNIKDTYFHIDHYRPKSIYYWQVYSWDNLLLCCEKCNKKKGDKFEIEAKKRVEFKKSHLNRIHNLTPGYNKTEKALMINPELEDIENKLIFDIETGNIRSEDHRCQYTIDCCKMYRKEANSNRKKIWDGFYKKVSDIFYRISVHKKYYKEEKIDANEFERKRSEEFIRLKDLIGYFIKDAYNSNNEYLAFRRYIVRNHKLFLT